jgi:hypothetical protein
MRKELIILICSWVIAIILLLSVSKGRTRLTQITFLFTQTLAWLFEYILVFFNLVEFPYREFKFATRMGFSLYYILFPTVGVLFIIFYPKQPGKLKVFLYYLLFSMVIPTFTSLAAKYSELFHFIHWNWGIHVLSDLLNFYILRKFVLWYQKGIEYQPS